MARIGWEVDEQRVSINNGVGDQCPALATTRTGRMIDIDGGYDTVVDLLQIPWIWLLAFIWLLLH